MQVAYAQGDPSKFFVVDRRGIVYAVDADTGAPVLSGTSNGVVLDIRSRVYVVGDGGMLSAAFPNDFAATGVFYVYYNRVGDNANVLSRFRLTPGTLSASPTSEEIVLITPHGFGHNGGWSAFSPVNDLLYLSLGDDGTYFNPDPLNRAQTTSGQVFNGKVLRLDVSGGPAADDFPSDPNRNYRIPPTNPFVGTVNDAEIWSFGLRNPWRCGFDLATGDLWIADVGQSAWEEINFQPASSSGGQNYGWRCMEGQLCTPYGGCLCHDPLHTPALFAYGHDEGCSISGGSVYRGPQFPQFDGLYFYSDYCSARVWTLRQTGGTVNEVVDRTAELLENGGPTSPIAICNDARGDLYLIELEGPVYKLLPGCVFDSIDFNRDMLFPDTQDIDDFLSVFSGGLCSTGTCGDLDFNNDGLFPDTGDITVRSSGCLLAGRAFEVNRYRQLGRSTIRVMRRVWFRLEDVLAFLERRRNCSRVGNTVR